MFRIRNGALCIGALSCAQLVETFGEPIYVYDGDTILGAVERLRAPLPRSVQVLYAMGANPNVSIVAMLDDVLEGIEACCLGEFHIACAAGVDPARITFVDPARSDDALRAVLLGGIGCIVIHSEADLAAVDDVAGALDRVAPVALKIALAPLVDPPASSPPWSVAGLDPDRAQAVLERGNQFAAVSVKGLYVEPTVPIGKPVTRAYVEAAFDLVERLGRAAANPFEFVNIGAPFEDAGADRPDLEVGEIGSAAEQVASVLLPGMRMALTVGRPLVEDAGVYITRIHTAVTVGSRTHYLLGGVPDFSGPVELLDKMTVVPADTVQTCARPPARIGHVVVTGLSDAAVGDLVGFRRAGAFSRSAGGLSATARGTPAEVLVVAEQAHVIRRASDLSDLTRDQILVLREESFAPAAAAVW